MTIFTKVDEQYTIGPGECWFAKRNHLARYVKYRDNGRFDTLSVFFDQPFLKTQQHAIQALTDGADNEALLRIEPTDQLMELVNRHTLPVRIYPHVDATLLTERSTFLDAIIQAHLPCLLRCLTSATRIRLTFNRFILRNFRFNVSLRRFSYIIGRSLTVFKRDFQRVFNESPGRWLLEKRLQEARFLIEVNRQKVSDVYLTVGFEDLSHFSYAFRRRFGQSPRQLGQSVIP
ncbi:helix-turn-helix domain-containing protein [Spirosoma sp. KUDC1026]|uniref:helix-turn-helix domain-containing protein n=1 Tax=Spirosoma sp. KUDC1026 TaxID=2745947 RepID=UPI00159BBCFD|nr:helix-turn-helix domain-containing protein [Spirosoma sp. KUDC1026]QKZ13728.1 helix-turn-helix transcriptional regulator [Spirosoma sp. KUDC1026]